MSDVQIGKYDPQTQNAGGHDPRDHIFPLNRAYMTHLLLFIIQYDFCLLAFKW